MNLLQIVSLNIKPARWLLLFGLGWGGLIGFGHAQSMTATGAVTLLLLSGDPSTNITVPYVPGNAYAHFQMNISNGATSNAAFMEVDSEAKRAMVMGVMSSLTTAQQTEVSGDTVSTCAGTHIQPIHYVTFQ